MDDLHLADFVELQLKSKHNFNAVYDVALSAGMGDYMTKFVSIQPGNWPCQFYCRQIIYGCLKRFTSHNQELGNMTTDSDMIVSHSHSVIPFHSLKLQQLTAFHIT